MRRYLLISILAVTYCFGQMRGSFAVHGEVEHDLGDRVDDLYVELYEQDRHTLIEKVPVAYDGGFELRQAALGNYEVRLVDRSGTALISEYTSLTVGLPLKFRFTPERRKKPGGSVSLTALKHPENGKAMREFRRAVKDHAAGDVESSFAHLQKSVALDPTYAPAHNQLGLIAATRGNAEAALLEFEKAATFDPMLPIPHCNFAIALLRAGRSSEAEVEARKAIQLDPNYVKAQSVLALCLRSNHPSRLKPAE